MAGGELPPLGGPPLTFPEVQRLVEARSKAIRLECDDGTKGRFLVAKRRISPGEVIFTEQPLFRGKSDAACSRKAYTAEFVALTEDRHDEELEDDCLHPRSPLVDCLASIILTKQRSESTAEEESSRARARLRLRQLASLHHAEVTTPVPEGCARELRDSLRPELRELISEDEIHNILWIVGTNRFGTQHSQLDLMYAGSMFEHSCGPNCFVGSSMRCSNSDDTRQYRALREIEEGEALSIDYLLLPDSYLGAAGRAALLAHWGFACQCPRCTSLPELTRSFRCPACAGHELCPPRPGAGAELVCRTCGITAPVAYAARCLAEELVLLGDRAPAGAAEVVAAAEAAAAAAADGGANEEATGDNGGELISRYHLAAFNVAWSYAEQRIDDDEAFRAALEALVECISRVYGQKHPQLLDLYHELAVLEEDDLGEQQHYLQLEHGLLKHFYPEEAQRQDDEILKLVQGRGPHQSNYELELGAMD
mmetsp:Transcript_65755/g.140672  ORF Transcript_65755/g.140672 Transcript_65755/m.140672 type:complete len:481 (-) Transcript_65755:49-1491(-)